MKKVIVTILVIIAVVFIAVIINFCGLRFTVPIIDQNTQKEPESIVVPFIITTDITNIEELQTAITENEELFANNALIVGESYVVSVKNQTIISIQPITKTIKTKTKKKDTGKIGVLGSDVE